MNTYFKRSVILLVLLLLGLPLMAQTVVRGKVVAKDNKEPLISVSVTEVDANGRFLNVTITNYDGEYVMQVVNTKNKLVFKYMGFEEISKEIGDNKVINVEMIEQSFALGDIVKTGKAMTSYGSFAVPQREVSMAMQKISTEEFDGIQVSSIDDALQGRIAGMDIVAMSGAPGAAMSMRIRGTSTLDPDAKPLIVLNDVPYNLEIPEDFDFQTANEDGYSDLLNVNPDDIESITVLKDAASAAIWGASGSNGVLMIYTKKGKRGPTRVNYSYALTRATQPKGLSMLNGDDFTMLMKQAYYNPTLESGSSNIPELNYDPNFTEYENYNNNTDWWSAITRTAYKQDNSVTITGGGDKVTFRVSLAYLSDKGTIYGQDLSRLSLRSSIEYDVSNRIRFSSDLSYSYSDADSNYDSSLLGTAYKKMPNLSVYAQDLYGNDTDVFYHIRTDSQLNDAQKNLSNPLAMAMLATLNNKTYRTSPNFRFFYELLDKEKNNGSSLALDVNVAFDINNGEKFSYLPKVLYNKPWDDATVNNSQQAKSASTSLSLQANLNWRPIFKNEDHSLMMQGRFSINTSNSTSMKLAATNIPSSLITSSAIYALTSDLNSAYNDSRGMKYSGVLHYAFKGRYIFDTSITVDGSSKFGKNYKMGNFPGLSAKWIVADESFWDPIRPYVNIFSPRISWGINGKEPNGDYAQYTRYKTLTPSYMGMEAVYPVNLELENIRWEKTVQSNYGLDMEFLEGKYTFDVNYYMKKTTDLLIKGLTISSVSGFSTVDARNGGAMDNEGWEMNASVRDIVRINDFRVNFNFNLSNNKNTIVALSEDAMAVYNKPYEYKNGTYLTRIQPGNPLGSIYGFKYKGVYQYTKYSAEEVPGISGPNAPVVRDANGQVILDAFGNPKEMYYNYGASNAYVFRGGDAIYEDVNHDGSIDELDIVYLGNSNARLNGGFGLTFRYKNFSVNTFFNYRVGNKVVNSARMNAENMYTDNNQSVAVNWRWRKEGDVTEMPRALYGYGYNWLGSDRYVEDASFMRFKYLTINYSIPREYLKPLHINNMSLYLSIQNLAVWTKYTGVDPEVGYGGNLSVATDNSTTPRGRDIVFRFRIGF